jgi:myosin-7
MHPSSIDGVEDMIDLGDLHEASVLRNLLIRSRDQKHIYTFIGSVILAVNPHQQLNIYTIDFVRSYHTRRIGELPAHIFAIAESAHARISKHQFGHSSVILSGEAGSGKTESSKLILHYLTTVCGQHSFVEQQLLEANTIIEAFGNASTLYNDNSSRFGKYTRVFFDQEGRVKGARLSKFLLEKSRVVQHGLDERNFHIFYMLFNLSQKEKLDLELQQPVDYHLLNQGKNVVEGRDDRNELKLLRESLNIMSFTNDEVWQIFSVLAALLHFGNLKYNSKLFK